MEDRQAIVSVAVYPYHCFDVVVATLVTGYLQGKSFELYTIVLTHRAFELFTQNVVQGAAHEGDKRRTFLLRWLGELLVEHRHIALTQIAVGHRHVCNAR